MPAVMITNEQHLAALAILALDELNQFQLARVEERFELAKETCEKKRQTVRTR